MKFSGFISASIDNSAKFHVIYRSDHIVSRGVPTPPRKINPHLQAQPPPSSSDINPQHQGLQPPAQKRD